MTLQQLEQGRAVVENQYSRVLGREGNLPAQKLIERVFEVADRKWRGIGNIPMSGFHLRDEFSLYDAEKLFDVAEIATLEPEICISGQILRGIKKPHDCPAFGTLCTPQRPLGATMVSAEGACAAYYAYGRHLKPADAVQIEDDPRQWLVLRYPPRTRKTANDPPRPDLGLVRCLFFSTHRLCWGMAAAASLPPI